MDFDARDERRLPTMAAALRHHRMMTFIIVLLGLGAGAVYATSLDRSYTASAIVLLNPVAANPLTPEAARGSGAQLTVALETEAEVVMTPSIAEEVSERLGRLVPDDGEHLAIEVPSGTQMVKIAFTTASPEAAREGAQLFAETYLDYRRERATSSIDSSLVTLRAEATEAEEGLRAALAAAEEDTFAAREVDLLVDRMAAISSQISTLESTMTDPGHVLQPARAPSSSNELNGVLIQAGAGILALGLAALIAWYREWRSGLVSDTAGVEMAGGAPIFAAISVSSRRRRTGSGGGGSVHEAYRHLRAGVVANALRPHSLAVSAIGGHRDAPVVATNLALVLAEARYSVLLVAANPTDSTIEDLMDIGGDCRGLADVLAGESEVHDALVQRRGLAVLPGGRASESVRELYAGPRFRQVLDELRCGYDFLVLSSAGAESADGDAIASAADSILMVLAARTSTQAQVHAALERYGRLGARALGAVTVVGGPGTPELIPPSESVTRDRGARVEA